MDRTEGWKIARTTSLEPLQRMSVGDKMHRVVVTGIGMVAP